MHGSRGGSRAPSPLPFLEFAEFVKKKKKHEHSKVIKVITLEIKF